MKSSDFLQLVQATVGGDRQKDYGCPTENLQRIADLWSTYFQNEVTAKDVAVCMMLLKIARLSKSQNHFDSVLDIAGYAACMAEFFPDYNKGE